jgi:cysteine desulfurase
LSRSIIDPPVYLDNAATTPVRRDVLDAMLPFLEGDGWGNPSSAHHWGRTAKAGVENARKQVAQAMDCEPQEVIFTSGGTEADNLAIIGSALAARRRGEPFRVAVTALEHPAILAAADAVESMGGEKVILPVGADGRVIKSHALEALESGLAVLSAMWVNNEIGTIQDIEFLSGACGEHGTLFHTDAVQALGKVPCSSKLADMTSISGHKIGAPKGVGAIILKDPDTVESLTHGGNQQGGVRPGTENSAGIVGLGAAAEFAAAELNANRSHFRKLQDQFESGLRELVPTVSFAGETGERAPHVSSALIPGIDTDAAIMHLDLAGIGCSTGSACKTGTVEPSRVLLALGVSNEMARNSLRFSYYKQNTAEDIERVLPVLSDVIHKTRNLSGAVDG